METDLLTKLTEITKANLSNENFGPEELARKMGVSHSTLHRKLKEASGKTISQFIREIRLTKASHLLLSENANISEIAYKVGFGSATYFNRCFHEQFGCSPGEYKKSEQSKAQVQKKPKSKRRNATILYVIPVLIIAFVLLFVNHKYSLLTKKHTENSIAVLPFSFHGKNQNENYLARATENTILHHLQKIKNLRVVSGISKTNGQSAKVIGREQNVAYILEGYFQESGSNYQLLLFLKRTKDNGTEWSGVYDWDTDRISTNESKAAQAIAKHLNAVVVSSEKQLIEKIPTTNLIAFNFYQRGIDEFLKYDEFTTNRETLEKAEYFFRTAIEKDKTFALAYSGLAQVYWAKNYKQKYFTDNFLDSVLYWTEKSLQYDNNLDEAHLIRGLYFIEKNKLNKALNDINMSVKLNPNNWRAFEALNRIYTWHKPDMVKALDYGHKAINHNQGKDLIRLYAYLGFTYACVDFFEEAQKFYFNSCELRGDRDSANFYREMARLEEYQRNYKKADEYLRKALQENSDNPMLYRRLGGNYNLLEDFEKSLFYYHKYFEVLQSTDIFDLAETHRLAQAYYETGNKQKAEEYFNIQIEDCKQAIEKNRGFAKSNRAYYDLAMVFAFKGIKEEAYKSLDEFAKMDFFPIWWINLAKDDPLSKSIRHEKRFQNIIKEMEIKFEKEHERVKKWLEENEIL